MTNVLIFSTRSAMPFDVGAAAEWVILASFQAALQAAALLQSLTTSDWIYIVGALGTAVSGLAAYIAASYRAQLEHERQKNRDLEARNEALRAEMDRRAETVRVEDRQILQKLFDALTTVREVGEWLDRHRDTDTLFRQSVETALSSLGRQVEDLKGALANLQK